MIERNIDVAIKYIENKHNIDPIHYQPNKKVIESNNNTIDNIDIIDTINTDTADNKVQIQKPCPACESMLDFSDKKEECPVCSALLIKAQKGVWDR